MNRLVVISGCSGGGKSTLLNELGDRGYVVVEEPGRKIVVEETKSGGSALPWIDPVAFAHRAIEMSRGDIVRCSGTIGWVFFDRGLVDAAAALSHLTSKPVSDLLDRPLSYHQRVFLAPPWPEIYAVEAVRRHTLTDAVEEYERLVELYSSIGYEVDIIPKATVDSRADYVLQRLIG
jgi:predicted ATPase